MYHDVNVKFVWQKKIIRSSPRYGLSTPYSLTILGTVLDCSIVYCGTPPLCLKVMGWGWVVAHKILVSAQGPLVFGFLGLGLRGLGPGLDNRTQITIQHLKQCLISHPSHPWT